MLTVPAPIERVERTNVVMIYPTQRVGLPQHNFYAIEVDRERNCYICRGFGHLAQNCRR